MSKTYIPSTSAGKAWSIGFVKSPGRPAYWSAIEGELKDGFFSFMMFQARTRSQKIDGPATAKKKEAALAALVASLKAEGLTA